MILTIDNFNNFIIIQKKKKFILIRIIKINK